MAREIINVGSAPNDGTGDPIRNAYIKCNNNFAELYSFPQSSPPPTLKGEVGDKAGMYAYDNSYFYWCFADYTNGVPDIWAQTSAGIISEILNGNSNVSVQNNGNVLVSVGGTGNVAVFTATGLETFAIESGNIVPSANLTYDLGSPSQAWRSLYVGGNTIYIDESTITANAQGITLTNAQGGSMILEGPAGNTSITIGQLDVLGNIQAGNLNFTGEIAATGNVLGDYFIGDGSFLTNITVVSNLAVTQIANATSVLNVDGSNGPILVRVNNVGNVAVFNSTGLDVNGNLDVSGNIIGSYFIGDGSNLTGVGNATAIVSGNTLMQVLSPGGSIRANVAGGTVAVFSPSALDVTGSMSATGNVSGSFFIGNGSQLSGIAVSTIAQGTSRVQIVSSGGNIISNVASATIQTVSADGIAVTGNATVSNTVTANSFVGTISTATQPFITQVGVLPSLTANTISGNTATFSGNVQVGNLSVTGNVNFSGNINQISGNSGQFFGEIGNGFQALYAGVPTGYTLLPQEVVQFATNFNGYAQFSMQNDNGGNEATVDLVLTADNGNNVVHFADFGMSGSGYDGTVAGLNNGLGTALYPNDLYIYVVGDAAGNPGLGGNIVMGTPQPNKHIRIINGGSNLGDVSAQFNPVANATSTSTGTFVVSGGIGVAGNSFMGGTLTINSAGAATALINGGANGVGNIGSASTYFNTVFAKSTSAQYADLAEQYLADADYEPGTVLKFGGTQEVTTADQDHDAAVAGVVSENPAYLMNSTLDGKHVVSLALAGRVRCKVQGPVHKGSMLVSAGNGRARAEISPVMGAVIGKSLQDFQGEHGIIEIVVGRL